MKTKLSPAWDLQLSSESQCLKPFGNQSVAIPFFQNTAAPFAGFSLRLQGGAEICSSTSSQQGALSLISGMRQLNKHGEDGREATGTACPSLQVLVHPGMSK